MKIIKPKVEFITATPDAEKVIELAGRTCYKSEDKITEDSYKQFCKMIKTRNHMSVLEHASATFRIICDRGVMAELTRHRIGVAFSIESTRYCNYSSDKKGMQFIQPACVSDEELAKCIDYDMDLINDKPKMWPWYRHIKDTEYRYNRLIEEGLKSQEARAILPNCLKTEIVVTANFREWLHILELRTSKGAHPDFIVIAKTIGNELHNRFPEVFEEEF